MHYFIKTVIIFSHIFALSSSQSLLSLLEERTSNLEREENYSIEINREFESEFKHNILATKDHHSAAFLQCDSIRDGFSAVNPKCNLTISTRALDGKMETKTCNFKRIARKHGSLGEFKVLGTDRVLVDWMEGVSDEKTYMLYQVTSLDPCKSKKIVNITTRSHPKIVRRRNTFDIIFNKSPHCPEDTYCKRTYNLDGTPTSKAFQMLYPDVEPFYINFIQASDYESDDGLFIVAGKNNEAGTLIILSPIFGTAKPWKEIEGMNPGYGFVYTNTSGIATLCGLLLSEGSKNKQKLRCTWFNKNETEISRVIEMDFNNFDSNNVRIHSKKPGKVIFAGVGDYLQYILIDKFYSDGKCRRLEEIASKRRFTNLEMSTTEKNEYCFAYMEDSALDSVVTRTMKFSSKCVNLKKSSDEVNTCGPSHRKPVNHIPSEKVAQESQIESIPGYQFLKKYFKSLLGYLFDKLLDLMWY